MIQASESSAESTEEKQSEQGSEELTEKETEPVSEALELDKTAISEKIGEIEALINGRFLMGTDSSAVEDAIYNGMIEALNDPYSVYYTAQELKTMEESTDGVYSGIGMALSEDKKTGEITVTECFAGYPAARAGIETGDVLIALDGKLFSETGMTMAELVSVIRRGEAEKFTLGLLRDGKELTAEVVRESIEMPTVEYEMLDDQIGYLHILEFDSVTEDQFKSALNALEDAGMEKLIVDVRDNPGGVLSVVVNILDQMLPEGCVVYTEDKDGVREEYTSDRRHQFTKPLAVLINGNSASASEIFAGAIKDFGTGTLIGTTTFGKGIVQRIYTLSDGTGLKLTVAKYYTPNGTDIHEKGIAPDIEVEAENAQEASAESEEPVMTETETASEKEKSTEADSRKKKDTEAASEKEKDSETDSEAETEAVSVVRPDDRQLQKAVEILRKEEA
ncbi:MAG: S41 family peptidase [Eubacteriales bacterium]|nr:S41 family peptidase [Eubacteriales bacterium]